MNPVQQGFGAGLFWAAPAPGIFYPGPAPAPGKREHNFAKYCLKYVLTHVPVHVGHIFMFTLEKTLNDVEFHVIFVNY